jgi:hypothetical protein
MYLNWVTPSNSKPLIGWVLVGSGARRSAQPEVRAIPRAHSHREVVHFIGVADAVDEEHAEVSRLPASDQVEVDGPAVTKRAPLT